jgi:hypothetical protein
MPTMYVHQLFAQDNIPTFIGEDSKHAMSGTRIHSKKLATIVGPATPKVFLKTIRRNGGSVLIDASGSTRITPEMLLKLCLAAPAATIAFYNAPNDSYWKGNLWIFSHKGKRATDFSSIKFVGGLKHEELVKLYMQELEACNLFGTGNVVDFQAMQWLLSMPAPRYILTDGGWTGCKETVKASTELLQNSLARKKMKQIRSFKEMEAVLAKGRMDL